MFDVNSHNDPRRHVLAQQLMQKEGQRDLLRKKYEALRTQKDIFLREVHNFTEALKEEESALRILEANYSRHERSSEQHAEDVTAEKEAMREVTEEIRETEEDVAVLQRKFDDKKRQEELLRMRINELAIKPHAGYGSEQQLLAEEALRLTEQELSTDRYEEDEIQKKLFDRQKQLTALREKQKGSSDETHGSQKDRSGDQEHGMLVRARERVRHKQQECAEKNKESIRLTRLVAQVEGDIARVTKEIKRMESDQGF